MSVRRTPAAIAAALAVLTASPALADAYSDFGVPGQCGTYDEVSYDRDSYFPGGEGAQMSLTDPQSVRGLNVLLFDGVMTEEGANDPAGRVLATRGKLLRAGEAAGDVVVIVTEAGIRILQRCP